jgi:hypothetical protein
VFAHPLVVIVDSSGWVFATLQSTLHTLWVWKYCATNLDLLAYTASSVLETFPFPSVRDQIDNYGIRYVAMRDSIRIGKQMPLNDIYNRFHDSDKTDAEIQKLRDLHVEMDQAVAAAYGWSDLELGHDFYETKQGVRFTISEPARREVLQRLLKLNHERYAEEEKQGLHGKKGATKKAAPKKKAAGKPAKEESTLFDMEDDK